MTKYGHTDYGYDLQGLLPLLVGTWALARPSQYTTHPRGRDSPRQPLPASWARRPPWVRCPTLRSIPITLPVTTGMAMHGISVRNDNAHTP